MDRRPSQSCSPAEAAALRIAAARRGYQAVMCSWTQDLLLLRARGLLTPGTSASPVRPAPRVVASPAVHLGSTIKTTHSPSLRHAA